MLNFKRYFVLNERHNNVADDINKNVKLFVKELANHFKTEYSPIIYSTFDNINTDYQYIIAGLSLISDYALRNKKDSYLIYNKNFDIKIKNRKVTLPIDIQLIVDNDEAVKGSFSLDKNEQNPRISIQLDTIELYENSINKSTYIVRTLINTLSHEVNHCYQWLSKKNYNKGEVQMMKTLPKGFSFLVYYIKQSEIESVCSSAYSLYKNKGKKIPYLNVLLRLIDFSLSSVDNDIDDYKLTLNYLSKKYNKLHDFDDLFVLKYFIGCALPKTRYYKLVADNNSFKAFVQSLNRNDLNKLADTLDEIYSFVDDKASDKSFNTAAAFNLLKQKDSLKHLLSSSKNAKDVLNQIKNNDFDSIDTTIYDEEEDEVIKGRPDIWR